MKIIQILEWISVGNKKEMKNVNAIKKIE